MKKTKIDRRAAIRTMVTVAVFCAVAFISQFIFKIRVFGFLSFDAKDAVMAVGAMAFGPASGFLMSILLATLESITMGETGVIGWIMDVLSTAPFVCVSAWVYRRKRTMNGAILALAVGVLTAIATMMAMNVVFTPAFMMNMSLVDFVRIPFDEEIRGAYLENMRNVVGMIPTILLPFNVTKAFLNGGLVLVLYKPISTAMKHAKVIKGEPASLHFDRKSILMLVIGILVIAVCITAFLLLMNGQFEWG